MPDRIQSKEALSHPSAPDTNSNLAAIWGRCAFAAAFIFSVMNWGQYIKADKDLSAMDENKRAAAAAQDVDIWRDEPFYWQAAFLGSYLGALKHDIREKKTESAE